MLQKILIVSFLFSIINCTCSSYLRDDTIDYDYDIFVSGLIYKDSSASAKECKQRSFNEEEQRSNAYKCCYMKYKCDFLDDDDDDGDMRANYVGCIYLTKYSYDNIKKLIKKEKQYCDKLDVDCSGTLLSYAYLMLLMLFLL